MTITQIETSIRYLTDVSGEKTDVLIPVELWEKLLEFVQSASGLDPIDELEPNSQILADIETSIREIKSGQTFPISELWQDT